ncbi:GNAT family N-acetyltransferase [Rhodococcus sp. IEGM 1406]|uniref:GNAT family N-acetyltransferase n=1 Tax=Rhodococcus sp. IEGM 1406 TaxID=3047083 RepID=UPI0024B808A4|nr:GNAT family N-acetyltransferase [Rhodococcus sp. IEGM 1406]MDI9906407.1 GNAT family N-acetyltransferase [Rhodococcus sp. IEGM 1406]
MIVRERVDGDLDGCVDALAQVHECDGYPNMWPQNPHRWLSSPTVVKAWVGESDGRVVGHVVVDREVAGAPTTAGSIAVSRLFVHPHARGNGLSGALLDAVTDFAVESQLELVLDVVEDALPAIALYERRGWVYVDERLADWTRTDGVRPVERRYRLPL